MKLLVGDEVGKDEHQNFVVNRTENEKNSGNFTSDDSGKPIYDINQIRYGEKYGPKRNSNTWVSGVIVVLLVVATAVCIILVVRRKAIDYSYII